MTTVEIEYCESCGMRGHAFDIQEAVLDRAAEELDEVSLVPAHGGIVIVRLDGEQVFHSGEDDYDTETFVETIADDIEERLG
jgi:selT/selW/selH-like putative selenoprotein